MPKHNSVIRDGWTPAELHEYARLYFFKNGRDYPTAQSYRRAIAYIVSHLHAEVWLKSFRKGGSKPLPPRREGLLQRGRGLAEVKLDNPFRDVRGMLVRSEPVPISSEEYAWPGHTEDFRSMIEQRARDYFKISPGRPVHVNAWAASKRAYEREQWATAEKLRKETEATAFSLVPKSRKKLPKGTRRKLAPQFDLTYWGQTLKPHFNYEFPGHTEAFREEVAALARKDRGKKNDAYISPSSWKIACHKHYELRESGPAT
jgi:hypothetical protein